MIATAMTAMPDLPMLFGVPIDFILFALTLLGVALFHHHTLRVALTGLATIALYKIFFTGFKSGPGVIGFLFHLSHEWVILINLFCLLTGFALLSRHFEKSHVPVVLPKFMPSDWKGAFLMLVMVFVLSSFLDNIAAALIGGAMAHQIFRAKVHIGYLAAIVAASNAGGAWSVVGDTTTTMMWIDGVSPLAVFEAIIAASVALLIFGIPAAILQQKYSPILQHSHEHTRIDWARVAIVLLILFLAIGTNVTVNTKFPHFAAQFPFLGAAVWVAILDLGRGAPARLGSVARSRQGLNFSPLARALRVDDAGREIAARLVAQRFRPRLPLFRIRQYSPHCAGLETGRLRLGLSRFHGRFWWFDDLVRLVRRSGSHQSVSGDALGRPMDPARMVHCRRLYRGLFLHVVSLALAPRRAP